MISQNFSSRSPAVTRTLFWVAVLASVLAIFVHAYLLLRHAEISAGAETGPSICDINDLFSCSSVAASKYAEFLGVPVALWGMIANFVMAALLLWHPLVEDEKKPGSLLRIFTVSFLISGASVIMFLISSIALSKYCLFCMVAYVLSFIVLGCLIAIYGTFLKSLFLKPPTARASSVRITDLTPLLIIAAIALLAGFIANDRVRDSYKLDDLAKFAKESMEQWVNAPVREIALVDPLVTGPSRDKAKMTLVEFADFRCIHCKHAAPIIKAFVESHQDVRFEFQPWPLDGECNSSVTNTNGASCLLARMVWCAEKKAHQGWTLHEYIYGQDELYMTKDAVEAAAPQIATAAKMSPGDLKACTDSDEAKDAVRKQAEAGSRLGLQGTPGIYANGKVLEGGQSIAVLREAYRLSTQK
jgi:protein-disulfide isomerase/uncharacterized membrane protein